MSNQGTALSNIVSKDVLRKIQSETLGKLSSILQNSFGPNGSNSCIKKIDDRNKYSKDGHTILKNIFFHGIIEQSIKDDLEDITRHIVKTVGDGTTSAVILSDLIFKGILDEKLEEKFSPVRIRQMFTNVCDSICKKIEGSARECTLEDIRNITLIATNNNYQVADIMESIYKEHGMGVFIDVTPSTGIDSYLKSYDGMSIPVGFADSIYVNDTKKNTATVDHPEIYFFEHPVDTREIAVYFDAIISKNIIEPMSRRAMEDIVPTVIVTSHLSQDLCGTMDMIVGAMQQLPAANKLPLLIVNNANINNVVLDICQMCGARPIRKYIDAKIYEEEVAAGRAPTPDTIKNWAGTCDRVVADSSNTKFINPCKMYDESGEYSEMYKNLINYLNTELEKAKLGGDSREIGNIKRRIHSLESNMVEYFVGGISDSDRDSLRDLVEDAVLNCRSAAENGVGYAANCQAMFVIKDWLDDRKSKGMVFEDLEGAIVKIIHNAYETLVDILFRAEGIGHESIIKNGKPYNINRNIYSDDVITSIKSDTSILSTVCKIIGMMATCNQFILPTALHNVYDNADEVK